MILKFLKPIPTQTIKCYSGFNDEDMITIKRTNSNDIDFQQMVRELDADLLIRNGDEQTFYDQFNKIDMIKYAVVAYDGDMPAGCGAIKATSQDSMEVKRMFVQISGRGKGVGKAMLSELEKWAKELAYKRCVLETGVRQLEAISMYEKSGYKRIPNYGQYEGLAHSLCYQKVLV
jgi:putative acetyltransferase